MTGCPFNGGANTPKDHAEDSAPGGAKADFSETMSYGDYLDLENLLTCQRPLSEPEHHDEMLFIIQHQTAELWLKLVLHELRAAAAHIRKNDLHAASKVMARAKRVFDQLIAQWSVLTTLTPNEYAQFRSCLGNSSGFQSHQHRVLDFIMGNKNPGFLKVFAHRPEIYAEVQSVLHAPSIYEEFLITLAKQGYDIPKETVQRDFATPRQPDERVVAALTGIYENSKEHWTQYATAESLVDLAEQFQLWRFRHFKAVERIIGFKEGTGGTAGVGYLQRIADEHFFLELLQVRTNIPDLPAPPRPC